MVLFYNQAHRQIVVIFPIVLEIVLNDAIFLKIHFSL